MPNTEVRIAALSHDLLTKNICNACFGHHLPQNVFLSSIYCFIIICVIVSGASSHLTEELVTTMSPTAAAVAKIIKPGMKLTEVLSHP